MSSRPFETHLGVEEELIKQKLAVSSLASNAKNKIVNTGSMGLQHPKAVFLMVLWYLFSAFNLFANKYIITFLEGDPAILAMSQMFMCMILGLMQMKYSCGLFVNRPARNFFISSQRPNFFQKPMVVLGSLRFTTLVLGLTSLHYVAVSFTETVKSSAPLFTVLIARVFTGEKTGMYVNMSLLPIMLGLALCSATELSFNLEGFMAALLTNISECSQNVYSKVLLSGERHRYGPAELQFFTSLASFVIQLFASVVLVGWAKVKWSVWLIGAMLMNGAFFHFQSITEYALLEYITPVTHSVANTVKRAVLIWLSIIIFSNPVTLLSGLGTLVVIGGVLGYNKAKELDAQRISSRFLPGVYPEKIAL